MTYSNFIRFYLKALIFAVFFLIFWGALVKSYNAGLSVPDWPTTYGYNMFTYPVSRWKGGIFYEHLHRLIASLIGALTVVMAVVVTLKKEKKNIVLLSWISVFLVSFQGILGGLTVIYRLPVFISSAHGIAAQTFLVALILIYFLVTNKGKSLNFTNKYFSFALLVTIVFYIQLILAAFLRHTDSGLAILSFPFAGGNLLPVVAQDSVKLINLTRAELSLPPVEVWQVWLNTAHRLWALLSYIIFLIFFFVLNKANKESASNRIKQLCLLLFFALTVQIILGAFVVFSLKEPFITSLHLLNGAFILALAFLIMLECSVKTSKV